MHTNEAKRPQVFICSPFWSPDPNIRARNIAYAIYLCKEVFAGGGDPVCPHLLAPRWLDDAKPEERAAGLEYSKRELMRCDMAVVGLRYGTSAGMADEKPLILGRFGKYAFAHNDSIEPLELCVQMMIEEWRDELRLTF